jgi:hypothetical protein
VEAKVRDRGVPPKLELLNPVVGVETGAAPPELKLSIDGVGAEFTAEAGERLFPLRENGEDCCPKETPEDAP